MCHVEGACFMFEGMWFVLGGGGGSDICFMLEGLTREETISFECIATRVHNCHHYCHEKTATTSETVQTIFEVLCVLFVNGTRAISLLL